MSSDNIKQPERRPLIVNKNKKRRVTTWLIPLVVIIAIMVLLPRLIDDLPDF